MSTLTTPPTVIRHAQSEGTAAMVITVFNRQRLEFDAFFQTYAIGGVQDKTTLTHSEVWNTEEAAIHRFESWRATEIGDFPG